jgi:hypothetical protein
MVLIVLNLIGKLLRLREDDGEIKEGTIVNQNEKSVLVEWHDNNSATNVHLSSSSIVEII